jgi:hypothetical protein
LKGRLHDTFFLRFRSGLKGSGFAAFGDFGSWTHFISVRSRYLASNWSNWSRLYFSFLLHYGLMKLPFLILELLLRSIGLFGNILLLFAGIGDPALGQPLL